MKNSILTIITQGQDFTLDGEKVELLKIMIEKILNLRKLVLTFLFFLFFWIIQIYFIT